MISLLAVGAIVLALVVIAALTLRPKRTPPTVLRALEEDPRIEITQDGSGVTATVVHRVVRGPDRRRTDRRKKA